MTDSATDWQLDEFDVALDRWIEVERPTSDLVIIVADWLLNRATTPYASVEREPGFVNRWWGQVPGSAVDGRVVVCVYWVFEAEHLVRCDSVATLSLPL